MLQNIGRVIECLSGIDGHDDAAGKKRREIADDPIDGIVRDQRDAVARGEAGVADSARHVLDALKQLFAGGRPPRFADALDEDFGTRLRERAPNYVR